MDGSDNEGQKEGGGASSTTVAEALKVPDRPRHLTIDNACYYQELLLPSDFARPADFIISPEPFNPIPPLPHEIDMLFVMGPEGMEELDYDAMKALLYKLVHPDCGCFIDGVHHSFVNLAIVPEFLLDDDIALRYLDLKE